ncbi:MAG: hypothetical protein LAT57_08825 [Balneolales bacterium]|nr:hypothetical protein [Balneolales bacterium]
MKKIKLSCILIAFIGLISTITLENKATINESNAWVAIAYVVAEQTDATNGEIAALSAFGAIHGATQGAIYGAVFGGPVGFAVGIAAGL